MAKDDKPGKNFHLGHEARMAFEAWCNINGYDHKSVFWAGVRALDKRSHDDRGEFFGGLDRWVADFTQKWKDADRPSPSDFTTASGNETTTTTTTQQDQDSGTGNGEAKSA